VTGIYDEGEAESGECHRSEGSGREAGEGDDCRSSGEEAWKGAELSAEAGAQRRRKSSRRRREGTGGASLGTGNREVVDGGLWMRQEREGACECGLVHFVAWVFLSK
jgi:hypothetical protein